MLEQENSDSAWFCSSAPVTVTPSDDMAMPNPYVNLLSLTDLAWIWLAGGGQIPQCEVGTAKRVNFIQSTWELCSAKLCKTVNELCPDRNFILEGNTMNDNGINIWMKRNLACLVWSCECYIYIYDYTRTHRIYIYIIIHIYVESACPRELPSPFVHFAWPSAFAGALSCQGKDTRLSDTGMSCWSAISLNTGSGAAKGRSSRLGHLGDRPHELWRALRQSRRLVECSQGTLKMP